MAEPESLTRAFEKPRLVIYYVYSPLFALYFAVNVTSLWMVARSWRDPIVLVGGLGLAACIVVSQVVGCFGPLAFSFAGLCLSYEIAERGWWRLAAVVAVVNIGWPILLFSYLHVVLQYASEL